MWFRLEGSEELKMIEHVNLQLGAGFTLATLLFFASDCRWNLKAWLFVVVGAAAIGGVASGFLIRRHREQYRIRSSVVRDAEPQLTICSTFQVKVVRSSP